MSMSTNGNEELNMTHAKQDHKTFESGFHYHFLLSFIVGNSPHLFLHNPWLTESSGADQSIINPWGSAFYIIYIHINLAPALFNIKMSTYPILIG